MGFGRFLGFKSLMLIWFFVVKLVLLLLFMVMFVVVRLELIGVSFWCLESVWLCVGM